MSRVDPVTDTARALLDAVRDELDELGLLEGAPPSPEALQSTAPFAFDTLQFNQWLQWIFLPRTHELLDAGGRLPPGCDIAPMAEWFAEQQELDAGKLVSLLRRFDGLWG